MYRDSKAHFDRPPKRNNKLHKKWDGPNVPYDPSAFRQPKTNPAYISASRRLTADSYVELDYSRPFERRVVIEKPTKEERVRAYYRDLNRQKEQSTSMEEDSCNVGDLNRQKEESTSMAEDSCNLGNSRQQLIPSEAAPKSKSRIGKFFRSMLKRFQ